MNESMNAELVLDEMEFYACHGWYEEERLTGSKFLVNVRLLFALDLGETFKDLNQVVNYEAVYNVAKEVMNQKIPLIEEVCRQLLIKIKALNSRTQNAGIEVSVTKCNPPIGMTKSSRFTLRD
jgi:dihydroneopterin aldolase